MRRRDWLRLVGAGTASLALACGDNQTPRDLAVAILEPTADAFLVVVWARIARHVTIEITGAAGATVTPLAIGASGSGVLDVTGLAPASEHEVVVAAGDVVAGPYRVRTAPPAAAAAAVRVAVIADVDPAPEFDNDVLDHVIAAAPDFAISLGDFPYTDNGPPAQTVEVYRERHVATRQIPRVQALLAAAPLYAIYDDHEFRNDWDAMFAATEASRYAAAMQVWDEFFPVRGAAGEVRYRSWRWGAHAECFLLDCRRFRSANAAPDDDAKTMLGAAQRAWLLDGIARSTATFKLVLSSVPLDFGNGRDHWRGFTRERDAILDALVGVPGVVVLSADQHFFAAHRHAHGVREFQVGPLMRGVGPPGPDAPGVRFRAHAYNAALVEIDAAGAALRVTAIGPGGEALYDEQLDAAALTPTRA